MVEWEAEVVEAPGRHRGLTGRDEETAFGALRD